MAKYEVHTVNVETPLTGLRSVEVNCGLVIDHAAYVYRPANAEAARKFWSLCKPCEKRAAEIRSEVGNTRLFEYGLRPAAEADQESMDIDA